MKRYALDSFPFLKAEEEPLFAAPREIEKAVADYNRLLHAVREEGRLREVLAELLELAKRYPIFIPAGHLAGTCLALEERYAEAEELLSRVKLLDVPEDEGQVLDRQLQQIRRQNQENVRAQRLQEKREKLLRPLKADFAANKILQKSTRSSLRHAFADRAERQAFWAKLQALEAAGSDLRYSDPEEERARQTRWLLGLIVLSSLILLFFFWLVRPAILARRDAARQQTERLNWLEQELQERAPGDKELARLLDDYRQWLSSRETP